MIIGLTGYAGSGKDTIAKLLIEHYGFVRVAFADPIRSFCYQVNPIVGWVAGEPTYLKNIVDRDGWESAKRYEGVRRMLQNVGCAARDVFGDMFWVHQALNSMAESHSNIVVTDVRFKNEADALKLFGAQIWRVKRPNVNAVNNHISETEMEGYKVDQIFYNAGSLEDLALLVKERMRGLN